MTYLGNFEQFTISKIKGCEVEEDKDGRNLQEANGTS